MDIPIEALLGSLVIILVFLAPGWAFLALTSEWKFWQPLQRWALAFSLSAAFYPVFFYLVRWLVPGLSLGPNKNLLLLAVFLLGAMFGLRKHWKSQLDFDTWDLYTLAAIGAAVFSRFWLIRGFPYPAWSDSLHHSLITQLVMQTGQLPATLLPYENASLDMYHLGFYALTGVIGQLANLPAHTALLWTAQALNGLCGVGVYLALSYLFNKRAAFFGVVTVGLLSFQPAWYVNWGRFTQLASQTILLSAWVFTLYFLDQLRKGDIPLARKVLLSGFVALLNAAVFLLHYRVAGYYLPLLLVTALGYGWVYFREGCLKVYFQWGLLIGGMAFLFVLPAFLPALRAYLQGVSLAGGAAQNDAYYAYEAQNLFTIGLQPFLAGLAIVGLILGLWRRSWVAGALTAWLVLLFFEGNLYRLGIPGAGFTNLTAIMIGLYIPASLAVGLGVDVFLSRLPGRFHFTAEKTLLAMWLIAGFTGSFQRASGVEAYRHFMTAADERAMAWIVENTHPEDVFAINTYVWLNRAPHGIDGGYWIPYFANRQTTTGTMMALHAPIKYTQQILAWSESVVMFDQGLRSAQDLCRFGIDYAYQGAHTAPGYTQISSQFSSESRLVYAQDGVLIYRLCDP